MQCRWYTERMLMKALKATCCCGSTALYDIGGQRRRRLPAPLCTVLIRSCEGELMTRFRSPRPVSARITSGLTQSWLLMMPSSGLMRPSRRRGCYGRCTGSWLVRSGAWGAGELSCARARPRVATPHSRHQQSRRHSPAYERRAPQHAASISTRTRPLAACIAPG
jgi:hypothetical protein